MKSTSVGLRRVICGGLSVSFCFGLIVQIARAERPATNPADQGRQAWEKIIQFYGDEETSNWSLRIADKNVAARATFTMLELWRFDVSASEWKLVDKPHAVAVIVPPDQKPTDAPDDETQILYQLSEITPGTYGLFYAKWRADGINGATFIRLGASRVPRKGGQGDKAPKGWLWVVVPLNLNKAELRMIPDPRVFCVDDAPETRPAR